MGHVHTPRRFYWLLGILSLLLVAPSLRAEERTTAPAADTGKILVLPFQPVKGTDSDAWLGRSIQQSILADLTVVAPARVVSSDAPAADTDAAISAGQKANARYVVFGSYHAAQPDLRITGQVIDTNTRQPVAGLKATGSSRDVFQLEDTLANQIKQRLALPTTANYRPTQRPEARSDSQPTSQTLRDLGQVEPSGPVQAPYDSGYRPTDAYPPAYSDYRPAYDPYYDTSRYYPYPAYSYPDYGYGSYYPYYYPSFGLAFGFGSFSHRGHHFDHDGRRGEFGRGGSAIGSGRFFGSSAAGRLGSAGSGHAFGGGARMGMGGGHAGGGHR